jgi:hypothetical protein
MFTEYLHEGIGIAFILGFVWAMQGESMISRHKKWMLQCKTWGFWIKYVTSRWFNANN